MGWFDGFRDHGLNTYYGDHRSPVLADVQHMLVILICIMFAAALILVIIGTRGRERWTTFLRVVFSLHTGVAILVTLFGQDWQVAFIQSHCSYSTLFKDEMLAHVHVRVGLKSVNITLEGDLITYHGKSHVDYNERFNFDKISDMTNGVLAAKEKGLPQPILYVAEYFAVDDGGLVWSRTVRLAGHFVFILQWASLAAWLVSNVVVNFVVFHGASIMILVGAMMSGACILYDGLQPATPFTIPFEDAYINFKYGWCFWLSAVSGGLTLVTGISIVALYKIYPHRIQMLFLLDTSHLVEHHDDADILPLELERTGSKPKESSLPSRPPAYINDGYVNDVQSSSYPATTGLRTRNTNNQSAAEKLKNQTRSAEQEAMELPSRKALGRRVSTISITSSLGPDVPPTVIINGQLVDDPLPPQSTTQRLSSPPPSHRLVEKSSSLPVDDPDDDVKDGEVENLGPNRGNDGDVGGELRGEEGTTAL